MEQWALCRVGNSAAWREACFPSSNSFLTAHAGARLYGALANGGALAGGWRGADHSPDYVVAPAAVAALRAALGDEARWLPAESGQSGPSRLSCGFSPWANTRMHGPAAARCFGHNGMNGCAAYCDPGAP